MLTSRSKPISDGLLVSGMYTDTGSARLAGIAIKLLPLLSSTELAEASRNVVVFEIASCLRSLIALMSSTESWSIAMVPVNERTVAVLVRAYVSALSKLRELLSVS